jgi:hypothetical protein
MEKLEVIISRLENELAVAIAERNQADAEVLRLDKYIAELVAHKPKKARLEHWTISTTKHE